MSKWTPGPWAYLRTHPLSGDMWFVVLDRDGRGPVVDVGGDDFAGQIAEAKYLITDPVEIEANARLIAEAPAMAECLKKCERLAWEIGCYTDDGIHVLHDDERGDLWREISGILERINK